MEEILKEILTELRWHSKQNEKIMELLGRLKKPCGQDINSMMRIFDSLPNEVRKSPMLGPLLDQLKEVAKDGK